MEQDLHTLLASVRDDAPPPRLSVDDITAAGRHLVRRRRRLTLLSTVGGGAVTAIAAVTAALMLTGAPQALTPAHDPSALPKTATPAPTAFAAAPAFVTTYRGYQTAAYQVSDPDLVTGAYQQSSIDVGVSLAPQPTESVPAAETARSTNPTRVTGLLPGGTLVVYRPEAFDPALFVKTGEKIPTRTGTGLLAYSGSTGPPTPAKTVYGRDVLIPTLAWQYTDNAWAVIYWSAWETVPDRDQLVEIADGLTPSTTRDFPIAFQSSYVPKGYALLSASFGVDLPSGDRVVSAARLTPQRLVLPIREPYNYDEMSTLTLALGRSDAGPKLAGRFDCDEGQLRCTKFLDDGTAYVSAEIIGQKSAITAQITQITLGIRPQSPDDTGEWLPVAKVFP